MLFDEKELNVLDNNDSRTYFKKYCSHIIAKIIVQR